MFEIAFLIASDKFLLNSTISDESLYINTTKNNDSIQKFYDLFSDQIQSITYSQPSLEDIFVQKTGYQFKDIEKDFKK